MRLIKFTGMSLVILVVLIAVAGGVWKYQLDSRIALEQPQLYEVKRGDGARVTLERLQQQGVIKWRWPFEALALWDKQRFASLKVGQFQLEPGMNAYQLLDKLSSNDVVSYSVTIPEGRTFAVMRSLINTLPNVRHDSLAMSDAELMAAIGHEGERPEGRFFPSTYRFSEGDSDLTLFKRAYNTMQKMLDNAWQKRSDKLPYKTPYEALIMASLVEQEAAVPEERSRIAGVFVRRLEKDMRLQTDPTVVYGLHLSSGRVLTRDNLRTDNPFNTYRHTGLPPTPISLPGEASIAAALNPDSGDALYFVAMGNGRHVFSATLEAHNRAVNRYVVQRAIAERSKVANATEQANKLVPAVQCASPLDKQGKAQAALFERLSGDDDNAFDAKVVAFVTAQQRCLSEHIARQALIAALELADDADDAISHDVLATVLELVGDADHELDKDVVESVSCQFAKPSSASDKAASNASDKAASSAPDEPESSASDEAGSNASDNAKPDTDDEAGPSAGSSKQATLTERAVETAKTVALPQHDQHHQTAKHPKGSASDNASSKPDKSEHSRHSDSRSHAHDQR